MKLAAAARRPYMRPKAGQQKGLKTLNGGWRLNCNVARQIELYLVKIRSVRLQFL